MSETKQPNMLKAIELNTQLWDWKWQTIWSDDDKIQISTLISRIDRKYYKTRQVKLDLKVINLADNSFECPNLFEFLTHYKLVEKANLKYPIIINNQWTVIDGRHRICKAILLGKKHLKAIQILDSTVI